LAGPLRRALPGVQGKGQDKQHGEKHERPRSLIV
jgi:hypothetical protein